MKIHMFSKKKAISGALALLTMTSFLLYGCGKGSQGGQSKAQKESKLVIAQISDAISLVNIPVRRSRQSGGE